ncbi:MAG: NADH-quinone oxidoreductase subunit C [Dehalococcoidia bacterium]|nr:NADH-quinone oxidoreductase subunit C [Dehalococcoidia bacterium]
MNAQTAVLLAESPVPLERESSVAANETLVRCEAEELVTVAAYLASRGATLATMVGLDLGPVGRGLAVEFVFSIDAFDEFIRVRADLNAAGTYPALTPTVPAAQWYEREAKDLLGIDPVGHPDPRRLVLHESFPHGYHPLRKEVDRLEPPPVDDRRFDHFEVHGEGIYELPVGPIHAGVIEPGHFRFSNIGDVVLFLDARLFYTHRGVEKIVEGLAPARALFTIERTCAACTVSHGVAFASAVERAAGVIIPPRASWLRTLLLELERLYNHVGDIGNICAGTGLHAGTARGAILKERLQRVNEALTGHRFLMGVVDIGGLRQDIDALLLAEQARELAGIQKDFTAFVEMLLATDSFVHRLKGPGQLDADLVRALGGTGVAARASGVATDYRVDHPHAAYARLVPRPVIETGGDVFARTLVRIKEAEESFRLASAILDYLPEGPIRCEVPAPPPFASALGYAESPRGSNVHWVMFDADGLLYRVRIRSAAYANWPLVARAVPGNVIPDFPLINKSFELCYACCDR